MKKIFSLLTVLILCLSGVQLSFASTLVFKITKEIKVIDENNSTEIAIIDVSKYKEIRIGVILTAGTPIQTGNIIKINAVEDRDFIEISQLILYSTGQSKSVVIDNLPPKIKISTNNPGIYKIFVWAS